MYNFFNYHSGLLEREHFLNNKIIAQQGKTNEKIITGEMYGEKKFFLKITSRAKDIKLQK